MADRPQHPALLRRPIAERFGRLCLWISGWKVEGGVPEVPRAIVIGAPHTSNWDFVFFLMAALVFRLRIQWVGKHTLFRPPLGWFLRAVGGVPVDRRVPHGLVGETARKLREAEAMFLMIPAEGTRSWAPHWKSGFYRIAEQAQVPIVLGYLDYQRKVAGLGPTLTPSGDIGADMERIRAFYEPIAACYPEHKGPIKLREGEGA